MASDPQDLTGRDLAEAINDLLGIQSRIGIGFLDPSRIPDLFAEIAARCPDGCEVSVRRLADGTYAAEAYPAVSNEWIVLTEFARGSTTNEALARLLLMVAGR